MQTTESGQKTTVCLSQRLFTKANLQDFAQKSLAAPATLASDGLTCFQVLQGTGIVHMPHLTGGGAASAWHCSLLSVNTVLRSLKTPLSGTHHSFGFVKYVHRNLVQAR